MLIEIYIQQITKYYTQIEYLHVFEYIQIMMMITQNSNTNLCTTAHTQLKRI